MNKEDLIVQWAKKTGLTKKDSKEALESLTSLITDTLSRGEEVRITGFGKFSPRGRKSSMRINPQTRQRMRVAARVVPTFKPGKNLREQLESRLTAVESSGKVRVKRR
ncbi:MAG TPA: HU family DNA-binding protein [Candidatus Fraserbacteria bacterium]|nr:HU family DNA-binding protein [Candidatus Fraserbacteria bacterium]